MIIQAQDLRKSYGDKDVVKGVSFRIPEGTTVGLMGPNSWRSFRNCPGSRM